MEYVRDDGGRAAAGFRGETGDCVTRAIAIATGEDYRTVYDALARMMRSARQTRLTRGTPRNGVPRRIYERYLSERGWGWYPTMSIGSGTRVHLREDELPKGRIIARLSRHLTAVIDGTVHDTFDPSRDGTRAVYGYFAREPQ